MSLSQKRKTRSILPAKESIDESMKTKSSKTFALDFKSPKLNRLKNFIKNPVPKSQNKYKQFQDNDENSDGSNSTYNINTDSSIIDNKISSFSQPISEYPEQAQQLIDNQSDSVYPQYSKLNPTFDSVKDVSQTSLLTTLSSLAESHQLPLLDSQVNKYRRSTVVDPMSSTARNQEQLHQLDNPLNVENTTRSASFKNNLNYGATESGDSGTTIASPSQNMTQHYTKHYHPHLHLHHKIPSHSPKIVHLDVSSNKQLNASLGFQQLTKSLSSNAIMDMKSPDGNNGILSSKNTDETDGCRKITDDDNVQNSSTLALRAKWDSNIVNIEATEIFIENIDLHIKETKQKLKEAYNKREQNVNDLITGLSGGKHEKSPGDEMKRNFEAKNRSNEKSLEKMAKQLEELERRRSILIEEGIPKGVDPKHYVKHITTERKSLKKKIEKESEKNSVLSKFKITNSMKSASAENVSVIPKSTSPDHQRINTTDLINSAHSKYLYNKDHKGKSATLDSGKSKSSSNEQGGLPLFSSTPKKPHTTSHLPDSHQKQNTGSKSGIMKSTSHSNSVCSGGAVCPGTTGDLPRKQSFSGLSCESGGGGLGGALQSGTGQGLNSESGWYNTVPVGTSGGLAKSQGPASVSGGGGIGPALVINGGVGGGGSGGAMSHISSLDPHLIERLKESIIDEAGKRYQENLEQLQYEVACKIDAFHSDLMLIRDETIGLRHQIKELHERIDKNSTDFNQKITMGAMSLATDLKTVEEKLDYQLEIARRFLLDKIESCSNNINLIEKRTEQLPLYSKYSEKGDMRIITDHFFNLIVSLIAFIMLLLSSGFHLLIKGYNLGAAISRYRYFLLPPLILIVLLILLSSFEHPWWVQSQAGLRRMVQYIFPTTSTSSQSPPDL